MLRPRWLLPALLAASLLHALPAPAAATSPQSPYAFAMAFEEEPRVGAAVAVVAVAERGTDRPTQFRLHATPGVQIDGDPVWRLSANDAGARRTWQVTVPQPMFWTLALYPVEEDGGHFGADGCCLHAWSGTDGAAWDAHAGDALAAALPPAHVQPEWTAEALGPDRVRVVFTGNGTSQWWPHADATAELFGSRMWAPYEGRAVRIRGPDEPPPNVLEIDLADGQRRDLSVAVTWGVLFAPPPAAPGWAAAAPTGWMGGEAYCRSHEVRREGDRLTLDDGTPCPGASSAWARGAGAPPLPALALALLALGGLRRASCTGADTGLRRGRDATDTSVAPRQRE